MPKQLIIVWNSGIRGTHTLSLQTSAAISGFSGYKAVKIKLSGGYIKVWYD